MLAYADLPALLAHCRQQPWSTFEPRRPLHLGAWQEDWDDNLAMLDAFAHEGPHADHTPPASLDAAALQDAGLQWENTAQVASTVLRLALDRGLPPQGLRTLYVHVVQVWRDYAQWLDCARTAGQAHAEAPIRTDTDQYQFALQLLAMAVLLDEEGEAAPLAEQLLAGRTDRLLDYLSAAATGLEEPNEDCLHPEPFGGLTDFFEQYGDVTAAPLLPYLQQHYQRFFALPPAEQQRHPRLTGPQAWGWWALEVGALVVLYDLDDTALRDVAHYPADLVDYALGVRD